MGPAGSIALHCFADPLKEAQIPDLANPDVQVVLHADEENGQLNATVHQPSDMAPEGVVEMLSDTTIEVVNAGIVEPVEAVEEGVDDADEDPDEVDVDDPLAEPVTPPLDGEQLNGFVGAELMVDTPTIDEPANLGTLIEDVTIDEGSVTLEWFDGSTTTFTNGE